MINIKNRKISLFVVVLLSYALYAKEELLKKDADLQTTEIKNKNKSASELEFEPTKAFSGCLAAVVFFGRAPLDQAIVACMTSVALALLVEKLGEKIELEDF